MRLNTRLFSLPIVLLSSTVLVLVIGEEHPDSSCTGKGGTCFSSKSHTCPNEIEASDCKKDEVCCSSDSHPTILDEDPPCTNTTNCSGVAGFCSYTCPIGHRVDYTRCERNCACCISEAVTPCKNETRCLDRGGYCSDQCNLNQQSVPDLCEDNCTCCISRAVTPCDNMTKCLDRGGYCSDQCNLNQQSVPDLCEDNCTCCISRVEIRCEQSECCTAANGRCDVACDLESEIGMPGLCRGESCQCCIEGLACKQTPSCTFIHEAPIPWMEGMCSTQCPPHLKSYPELCEGPSCTCCAVGIPNSSDDCTKLGGSCLHISDLVACTGITFGDCDSDEYQCCIPYTTPVRKDN